MINKKGYRADIDGLRAIAVLMVVWFHAKLPGFSAGFIGVDIFFVISGYLITKNIIKGMDDCQFSLLNFYGKRLLRLAPALLVLLLCLVILTSIFYLPEDYLQFLRTVKYTLLYKSNVLYPRITGGYFDTNSDLILLLHTWSLSVEWQWYLYLPIFFMIIYKLKLRRTLPYLIYICTILSFGYTIYHSEISSSAITHYYSFNNRIFELLVGSSVALLPLVSASKVIKIFSGAIGILVVISILIMANRSDVYIMFPNKYTGIVVFSTGILIYIGSIYFNNIVSRVLSIKPIVFIGVISYSLYLWHWPLFSFVRYIGFDETYFLKIILICLSMILGWLSWKYIEQTTRYLKSMSGIKVIIIFFITPSVFSILSLAAVKQYDGLPERFGQYYMDMITNNKVYSNNKYECFNHEENEGSNLCKIGSLVNPKINGLAIGDSYINQYWNFLDILSKDQNAEIELNSRGACFIFPDVNHNRDVTNGVDKGCLSFKARQIKKIKENGYDFVIIGQIWSGYLMYPIMELNGKVDPQYVYRKITDLIEIIIDSGATPVLINENYSDFLNSGNQCILRLVKLHEIEKKELCMVNSPEASTQAQMKDLFERIQAEYPQIIFINPQKVLCNQELCPPIIENFPIYAYTTHLNDYASYIAGKLYLEKFGNPLKDITKNKKRLTKGIYE